MKVEEFVLEVKARADASLGRVRGQMMGVRAAAVAVSGAVATAAAGIATFTAVASQAADDLAKGARRAGLTAEEYQAYGVAFERAGVRAGGLERAAKALAAAQLQAQRGSAEASEAFETLGVSATDSEGRLRRFRDILPDLLDALADVESESERLALAQVTLGRAAQDMASLIEGGGAGLRMVADRARVLGYAFDEQLRTSAENANDALADVGLGLRSLAMRGFGQLIPLLEDAAIGFRTFLERVKPVVDARIDTVVGGMVRGFRDLSPQVRTLAGTLGIAAVAAGFVRLGSAVSGFASSLGMGGAVTALRGLALPLLGIAAALLAVDDVLAFARGDDSLTGRILRYVGGEEAEEAGRRALRELGETLGQIGTAVRDIAEAAGLGDAVDSLLTALTPDPGALRELSGLAMVLDTIADALDRIGDRAEDVSEALRAGFSAPGALGVGASGALEDLRGAGLTDLGLARIPGMAALAGLGIIGEREAAARSGASAVDPARLGVSQTITIDARGASPEQAGRIAREVGQDEAMRIFAELGEPVSVRP